MSLAAAITAMKVSDATLTGVIGSRFRANVLNQEETFPAAKFQLISQTNTTAFTPVIQNYHARVQMDGYVQSKNSGGDVSIYTLRGALFGAFFGKSGSYGGLTIKAVLLDNEAIDLENLDTEGEVDHVRMDFLVDYE